MDRREFLAEELKDQKEKLKVLEEELAEEEVVVNNNPQYVELESKILDLTKKIQQDKRDPIPPKGSGLGIAASIIAIIVGFFVTKIISIIGAIGFIAVLIPRSISMNKQRKENDTLLAPTKEELQKCERERQQIRDQYPQLRVLENQISEVEKSIKELQSAIDAIDAETTRIKTALGTNDISQYEKNYVFIHFGYYYNSSVAKELRHQIMIDGQDFGYSRLPFSRYEMNPGVHTLKIVYQVGDSVYTTNVVQFRVEEESKMFVFKAFGATGTIFSEYKYNNITYFLNSISKK